MRPYYKNSVLVSPWSISNLRHLPPWLTSNHLAICVTLPCRLRHFTCSLILFRTLIPYLYPPLRPQMTALGTISSIEKPYEQREERFFRLSMLLKRGKQSTYLCQNPSSRISNGETNKIGNYIESISYLSFAIRLYKETRNVVKSERSFFYIEKCFIFLIKLS